MPSLGLGGVIELIPPTSPDLLLIPVSGPPGPPGQDGAAGGTRVTYRQTTAAGQWTIPHTFRGYPSVELIDATGHGMDTDVEFPDDHTVIVTFATPTAGTAVLT